MPLTVDFWPGLIVRDGFAVPDHKDTPEIEIKQIEDSTQGGAEAEAELLGELRDHVTWGAKGALFYPFFT